MEICTVIEENFKQYFNYINLKIIKISPKNTFTVYCKDFSSTINKLFDKFDIIKHIIKTRFEDPKNQINKFKKNNYSEFLLKTTKLA